MKNILVKKLLLALIMIFGLISCEDRDIITVENQSAPIVMDLSTENLYLDQNFPQNPALTVNWQPATFSVPVEVKYKVEISSTEAFADPYLLAQTSQSVTNVSFTNQEMNEAAKRIGLAPFESQKMYFRITSYLGENDMAQQSKITSINITPYLASPTYDYVDIYLIGNAVIGNWDNLATNNSLLPLLKTTTPGKYTYTGYFDSGTDIGFKMIKVKGSWDAQFGKGASDGLLSTDGGSGNLTVPSQGYYKLTVDINALTYSLEPTTTPTNTYSSVSIIGSVNGNWDTDTQLTQSTFNPHLWSKMGVSLNSGEFKFRANNSWDTSWGTNSEFFGTATVNGANIPLTAEWTYDVYFNDATGDYTLIPVK